MTHVLYHGPRPYALPLTLALTIKAEIEAATALNSTYRVSQLATLPPRPEGLFALQWLARFEITIGQDFAALCGLRPKPILTLPGMY